MNEIWEHNRYNQRLEKLINENDKEYIYRELLYKYNSGELQKHNSYSTLLALKDRIPLKNQLGKVNCTKLFLCDQRIGYFYVEILQRLIVNKECEGLARYINCGELRNIHYEDIKRQDTDEDEPLTADDIEQLNNSYFVNSEEILRGFYRDELISDNLLERYNLGYLSFHSQNDETENYTFPEKPVKNRYFLIHNIRNMFENKSEIISEPETRMVQKIKTKNGEKICLDNKEARQSALKNYAPEETEMLCFCQICRKTKTHKLIEVNNLEKEPKYYFPQMRITLCLDCSKYFEALRENDSKREKYIEAIKNVNIQNQGKIDIPIDQDTTLTFTATHLAEIQEILKLM